MQLDDDYDFHQTQITLTLKKYKKMYKILHSVQQNQLFKKLVNQLDIYLLFLNENFASEGRFSWLKAQRQQANNIKRDKQLSNTMKVIKKVTAPIINQQGQQNTNRNLGILQVDVIRAQINQAMHGAQISLQKAIDISTYIRVQLDRQIQSLDRVYDDNINFDNRLKRVKEGLILIIRRAMINKCTKCLTILLVFGAIALIVLYLLKKNGKINF